LTHTSEDVTHPTNKHILQGDSRQYRELTFTRKHFILTEPSCKCSQKHMKHSLYLRMCMFICVSSPLKRSVNISQFCCCVLVPCSFGLLCCPMQQYSGVMHQYTASKSKSSSCLLKYLISKINSHMTCINMLLFHAKVFLFKSEMDQLQHIS
jgi:hypothetical protein